MITKRLDFNQATISFSGLPHLSFRLDKFVGFQTWKTSDRWVLELTLVGGTIVAEYDTEEKFREVTTFILEITNG